MARPTQCLHLQKVIHGRGDVAWFLLPSLPVNWGWWVSVCVHACVCACVPICAWEKPIIYPTECKNAKMGQICSIWLGELIMSRYVAESRTTNCKMFRPCRPLSTAYKTRPILTTWQWATTTSWVICWSTLPYFVDWFHFLLQYCDLDSVHFYFDFVCVWVWVIVHYSMWMPVKYICICVHVCRIACVDHVERCVGKCDTWIRRIIIIGISYNI